MGFRFEQFEVWQLARVFAGDVYHVTRSFPTDEQFGITSQLRRAANSVAMNIAEGSDRSSDANFARFLRIAIASLAEAVTALYISKDQEFLREHEFTTLYASADRLATKLRGFLKMLSTPGVQRTASSV